MGVHNINSLLLTLLQQVYSYFSFYLPAIQLFISTLVKSHEDIRYSPPLVSVITGNILIAITRFVRYHLLSSNITSMTDFPYLGTIQI